MTVQYYKVISADNKSCNGGDFDWTDYLPKDGEPGKWTPMIENVVFCKSGYHVTEYWNMWYEAGYRIFECEVDGVVVAAGKSVAGVVDKAACTRIRLCKEIIPQFDSDYNTGYHNTGDHKAGNYNTGDRNGGHHNTGNRNVGHYNTGDCNIGGLNAGHYNKGNRNTGDYNTGHYNMGYGNTGDRNTGNRNAGDYNTGHHNTCNRSSGFFNTINDTISVFNKPCKIDVWRRACMPDFIYFDVVGTMKESWRKAYDGASEGDKLLLVKLPNFDADVFYEISGIMVDPKTGKELI